MNSNRIRKKLFWKWKTEPNGVLKAAPWESFYCGSIYFIHLQQFDFQSNFLFSLVVHVSAQLDALAAHVGRTLKLRSQGNWPPFAAKAASRLFVLSDHWFLERRSQTLVSRQQNTKLLIGLTRYWSSMQSMCGPMMVKYFMPCGGDAYGTSIVTYKQTR